MGQRVPGSARHWSLSCGTRTGVAENLCVATGMLREGLEETLEASDNWNDPDWELLKLIREVRRRTKAENSERFIARLQREPLWVGALPSSEAKFARAVLAATRELVGSAAPVEVAPAKAPDVLPAVSKPKPATVGAARRRRGRTAVNG
jgi:hypothetical protein